MPNNDIRYKLARFCILVFSIFSIIVAVLRFVFSWAANRFFFLGSNLVWLFADIGYDTYQSNGRAFTLVKTFIFCFVFIVAYFICWYFSKKYVGFLIGATVYFSVDMIFYILTTMNALNLLAVGTAFRLFILASLIIGVIFGRNAVFSQINEDDVASAKFINKDFSSELAKSSREIVITRRKRLLGSHISLRCLIDGNEIGVLKAGDEARATTDGNSHVLEIVALYSAYNAYSILNIPEGDNSASYTLDLDAKTIFSRPEITIEAE